MCKTFRKTFWTPTQVGELVVQLGFAKCKELKHHSSSMLPRTCTMAISTNLKYSKKNMQTLWMFKEYSRGHQRIHIKWLNHGNTCIWFHAQLEHKLLNVKGSYQKNLKRPCIIVARLLGWQKGFCNHIQVSACKLFFPIALQPILWVHHT
jgi:hypothetical protein